MNRNGPQLLKTTNQMGRGLKGSEMSWLDVLGRRNERRSWRTIWKLSKGTPDESHTICRTIFWRQGSQVPRYQELIDFLWMVRTVWIMLGCLPPWDHLVNMAMEHLPSRVYRLWKREMSSQHFATIFVCERTDHICGLSESVPTHFGRSTMFGAFFKPYQHGFKWQICGFFRVQASALAHRGKAW